MVVPGIDCIPPDLLAGRRVGLLAHPASLDSAGRHAADSLLARGVRLTALFGPEHGFYGRAAPGQPLPDGTDPRHGLPVYSLYGDHRAPTPEMLSRIDVLVFDLQTIACRAYTYGSTLRLAMEACAAAGIPLVVADRPDPLMLTPPDGPMLDPAHASFVGLVPTPFCHGLTPGELALHLQSTLPTCAALDLHVVPAAHLSRDLPFTALFPAHWVPPSPAIVTPRHALAFPLLVFWEAYPVADHARGTPLAFLRFAIDALTPAALLSRLPPLPGCALAPSLYPDASGRLRRGLRLDVADPRAYRPAQSAAALLSAVSALLGRPLDATPAARPDFYLKLLGAPAFAPPPPAFRPRLLY